MTRGRDHSTHEGGQVSAWLIRVIAIALIFGGVAIEGGAILINRIQTVDLAGEAAQEAGLTFSRARNFDAAKQAAVTYVADKAEVLDVVVNQPQTEITVTLRKTAHTFVVQKIDKFKPWTISTASQTAPIRVG